jgi:Tfp pilus assembly PilM family ATPase
MPKAVGIDIGTEALRGVVIDSRRGKLQLVSAGAAPLGEWAALEDNEDKRLAVGEKLKDLIRGAGLHAPKRRIAVTSKGAALKYLSVPPVPPWRLEMLARYEIEERTESKEPSAFDYRILDVPEIGGQYTVLLGALHERVVNWLMDICRQARMGEVEPDVKALALYNAYYHGHGFDADKTALIVDIGAVEITVLLVRNGALYLARTFEGGGQRFTQALSEELRATILEAEEIKKNEAEILLEQASTGATSMFRRGSRLSATAIRRPGNGLSKEQPAIKPGEQPARPGEGSGGGATETPGEAPEGVDRRIISAEPSAVGQPSGAQQTPAGSAPPALSKPESVMVVPLSSSETGGDRRDDLALGPSGAEQEADEDSDKRRRPMSAGDQAFLDELDDLQPAVKRRKQISQLLVRESAALCAALESALNYCRGQYKMRDLRIDTVYLTGAGSRLKGLSQLISRRLRAPVEPLDVFRQLDLSRLPKEAAETLRSEQDRMAVSTGLALSALRGGAFSFLLWPSALKEKKEFWARGAYLYYSAAALLAVLAIFFFTPHRNVDTLTGNEDLMTRDIQQAKLLEQELAFAEQDHEELQRRLEQIDLNAKSGAFFLKVLAELKDPKRIPQDVWLTSLSTNLPAVILKDTWPGGNTGAGEGVKEPGVAEPGAKTASASHVQGATPDTFQAQARLYLRGFVRSGQKDDLYNKIMGDRTTKPFIPGFCDLLVPDQNEPEDPRNLFKDIRPVWVERDDHPDGPRFLKEFVLEAYVEGSREFGKKQAKASTPTTKKAESPPAEQVPPVVNAPAAPATKVTAPDPKAPVAAEKKAEPQPVKVDEPDKKAPAPVPAKDPKRPATKVPVDPEPKAF